MTELFNPAAFLANTWQNHPLLIKNFWPHWQNPVTPDELAGLACEDGVESRLITETRLKLKAEHGPLSESRFAKLKKAPYTLLVQAVDHHIPAVAALLSAFRFIPNWRIDDVMVSYANDGGGLARISTIMMFFLFKGLARGCGKLASIAMNIVSFSLTMICACLKISMFRLNICCIRAICSMFPPAWRIMAWQLAMIA